MTHSEREKLAERITDDLLKRVGQPQPDLLAMMYRGRVIDGGWNRSALKACIARHLRESKYERQLFEDSDGVD